MSLSATLCRLCALELPIFDVNNCEQDKKIEEIIWKFLRIKLENNQGLPTNACIECCDILLNFNNFCKQVQNAQDKLQNLLSQESDETDLKEEIKDEEKDEDKIQLPVNWESNLVECDGIKSESEDSQHSYDDIRELINQSSDHVDEDPPPKKARKRKIEWRCYKCKTVTFRSWSNLDTHFRDVHNSQAEYICMECKALFHSVSELENHINEHDVTSNIKTYKIYKCEICAKEFNVKTNYDAHKYVHSGEKRFECDLCGKRFTLKQHMELHKFTVCLRRTSNVVNDVEEAVDGERSTTNSKKINKFKCHICNVFLQSVHLLETHFKRKHDDKMEFCCTVCNELFSELEKFQSHLNKHGIEWDIRMKPFQCETCQKRFTHKTNLIAHQYIHLDIKRFECETCGKRFTLKQHLEGHRLTHIRSSYDCDQCNKKCKTAHLLQRHLKTHLPMEERLQFECEICHKKFISADGLKGHHKQMHDTSNQVMCDQCGKYFRNKNQLVGHVKIHSTDTPYSCDICSKTFRYQELLKRHKTIHSGIKPHACEYCGKTFRLNAMLTRHKLIHTNEMPHECSYCKKAFRTKNHLKVHLRQHTGERPYSCTECNHHFTNDSNFVKHLKGRHGLRNFSIVNNHQYPFVN